MTPKTKNETSVKDLKAKLAETGYASDFQVSNGYWVVAIWKTMSPSIAGRAAGMTPISAALAAVIELIKNHV